MGDLLGLAYSSRILGRRVVTLKSGRLGQPCSRRVESAIEKSAIALPFSARGVPPITFLTPRSLESFIRQHHHYIIIATVVACFIVEMAAQRTPAYFAGVSCAERYVRGRTCICADGTVENSTIALCANRYK